MGEPKNHKGTLSNPKNAIGKTGRSDRYQGSTFNMERTDGEHSNFSSLTDEDFSTLNEKVSDALRKAGINPEEGKLMITDNAIQFEIKDTVTIRRVYNAETKTMEHDIFEINDTEKQGRGVSKAVHRALMPIYEKLGIEKIDLYAAEQNGGYTWAKYGFRVSYNEIKYYPREMKSHKEEAQKIINDFYATHPRTERFPIKILADKPWGKEAMSGSTWFGDLDLTNPTERADFCSYIGYKR